MAQADRTSTAGFDTTYINSRNIKTLQDNLVLGDYITPGELPKNSGSTVRWQIDTALATAAVEHALDGTSTAGSAVAFSARSTNEDAFLATAIEAQMFTFGAFIPVLKHHLDYMPKTVMDRISDRLTYRTRSAVDNMLAAELDGRGVGYDPVGPSISSNLRLCNISTLTPSTLTPATLNADDTLNAQDLALAVGDLWAANAEPFSNGFYAAVVHSGAAIHLVTDVSTSRLTWEEINKHVGGMGGQEKLTKGTIGGIVGAMVIRSNNVREYDNTVSAYANLVIGQDAIGAISMGDMKPRTLINKAGEQTISDPHRMYATVESQFRMGRERLDVNRAVVLVSGTG